MGLVAPRHVGSSQTRAQIRVPCIGRQILNHCTTREAPRFLFNKKGPPPIEIVLKVQCLVRPVTSGFSFPVNLAESALNPREGIKWTITGNSLAVQWLGLQASTAGDTGSIPGQGTRIPQAHGTAKRKKNKIKWTITYKVFCEGKMFNHSSQIVCSSYFTITLREVRAGSLTNHTLNSFST